MEASQHNTFSQRKRTTLLEESRGFVSFLVMIVVTDIFETRRLLQHHHLLLSLGLISLSVYFKFIKGRYALAVRSGHTREHG